LVALKQYSFDMPPRRIQPGSDPAYTPEENARAYFHANVHCRGRFAAQLPPRVRSWSEYTEMIGRWIEPRCESCLEGDEECRMSDFCVACAQCDQRNQRCSHNPRNFADARSLAGTRRTRGQLPSSRNVRAQTGTPGPSTNAATGPSGSSNLPTPGASTPNASGASAPSTPSSGGATAPPTQDSQVGALSPEERDLIAAHCRSLRARATFSEVEAALATAPAPGTPAAQRLGAYQGLVHRLQAVVLKDLVEPEDAAATGASASASSSANPFLVPRPAPSTPPAPGTPRPTPPGAPGPSTPGTPVSPLAGRRGPCTPPRPPATPPRSALRSSPGPGSSSSARRRVHFQAGQTRPSQPSSSSSSAADSSLVEQQLADVFRN